jgi:uroporphyrinogen III methyltransferase/synthase
MLMPDVPNAGFVSLVGAGPGDPALITVGGVVRLAEADVVVYDRLANPALLRHARAGAELIFAGKSPERHTRSQDEINALLVAKAREGKRVVRLKGGDPFVFGRGGEEAEALAAAGIAFEVIPGVTSAVAAPAYAGIPVTHRGIASSFAVITGHGAEIEHDARAKSPSSVDTESSSIDWSHVALGADTLVFLMGVGSLDEIAAKLVEHGRSSGTPVAVVEWGTMSRQRTVSGTLATIVDDVRGAGIGAPAVTVVGEVTRLRDRLRWFDARPLSGLRVLVTRTREQASELSRLLAEQGAEPIELPTIEIVETGDAGEIDATVEALMTSAYNWVVFTSPNAIAIFMRLLRERGLDARAFGRAQVAAIGPGSAAALERAGLSPDLVPAEYVAEGLLEAFDGRVLSGARVLLPRAESARDTLIEGLEAKGARVDELKLYRAAVPRDPDVDGLRRLREGEIDVVTFASSSAVRNLVEMLGGDLEPLRRVRIAAIGPVTADAVSGAGLEVAVAAAEYTIAGLVSAIVDDEAKPG